MEKHTFHTICHDTQDTKRLVKHSRGAQASKRQAYTKQLAKYYVIKIYMYVIHVFIPIATHMRALSLVSNPHMNMRLTSGICDRQFNRLTVHRSVIVVVFLSSSSDCRCRLWTPVRFAMAVLIPIHKTARHTHSPSMLNMYGDWDKVNRYRVDLEATQV